MRSLIYSYVILSTILISSCAEDAETLSKQSALMNSGNVETHDQLLEYLNEKYGGVEELPVFTQLVVGVRKTVPHKFRLSDGREISIDIVFTGEGERVLDPAFDLEKLPN
jgi:hypothetical protein